MTLKLFVKWTLRLLLATLFFAAGVIHLRAPGIFEPVMPPFVPLPYLCIIISGIFEILGGLGLLMPFVPGATFTSRWGLVALLIAVFPVNIYMAIYPEILHFNFEIPLWVLWLRLPLQPLLIWAVLWCTSERKVSQSTQ